jgi:hypothetical protein
VGQLDQLPAHLLAIDVASGLEVAEETLRRIEVHRLGGPAAVDHAGVEVAVIDAGVVLILADVSAGKHRPERV